MNLNIGARKMDKRNELEINLNTADFMQGNFTGQLIPVFKNEIKRIKKVIKNNEGCLNEVWECELNEMESWVSDLCEEADNSYNKALNDENKIWNGLWVWNESIQPLTEAS
jgi:hypothetical protein